MVQIYAFENDFAFPENVKLINAKRILYEGNKFMVSLQDLHNNGKMTRKRCHIHFCYSNKLSLTRGKINQFVRK